MNAQVDFTERFRLAQVAWAEKEGEADKLEEIKKITFSELVNHSDQSSAVKAEHDARCHPKYMEAVEKAVSARTAANVARAQVKAMEMKFERWRTIEATKRAEMNIR